MVGCWVCTAPLPLTCTARVPRTPGASAVLLPTSFLLLLPVHPEIMPLLLVLLRLHRLRWRLLLLLLPPDSSAEEFQQRSHPVRHGGVCDADTWQRLLFISMPGVLVRRLLIGSCGTANHRAGSLWRCSVPSGMPCQQAGQIREDSGRIRENPLRIFK